jgi:hypothetical protein
MVEGDEIQLLTPQTPDPAAVWSPQQIINSHVEDFGVDVSVALV